MTIQRAVLKDSNPLSMNISQWTFPATVSLASSAPSRLIELSADGGITYFTPVYDNTSANSISAAIFAPVSHVRFTGIAGDELSAR